MICDRCGVPIQAGEEMEYYGQTLCEECYMQALSPTRACDPWAVHSAQSGGYSELTETQESILQVLGETGGVEAEVIAERLGMGLPELRRELATLRHMEKVRGELREGRKVVCLW
jgi:hypothetical protein